MNQRKLPVPLYLAVKAFKPQSILVSFHLLQPVASKMTIEKAPVNQKMEYHVQKPQHPEQKSVGFYARYVCTCISPLISSSPYSHIIYFFYLLFSLFIPYAVFFSVNFKLSYGLTFCPFIKCNAAFLRCVVAAAVAGAALRGLVAAAKDFLVMNFDLLLYNCVTRLLPSALIIINFFLQSYLRVHM